MDKEMENESLFSERLRMFARFIQSGAKEVLREANELAISKNIGAESLLENVMEGYFCDFRGSELLSAVSLYGEATRIAKIYGLLARLGYTRFYDELEMSHYRRFEQIKEFAERLLYDLDIYGAEEYINKTWDGEWVEELSERFAEHAREKKD